MINLASTMTLIYLQKAKLMPSSFFFFFKKCNGRKTNMKWSLSVFVAFGSFCVCNLTPCAHVCCYTAPLIVAHAQIWHTKREGDHKNVECSSYRFDWFFQSGRNFFYLHTEKNNSSTLAQVASPPSLTIPFCVCFRLDPPLLSNSTTGILFGHSCFTQLKDC